MARAAMSPGAKKNVRARADQMMRSAPRKFGATIGSESQKYLQTVSAFGNDAGACKCLLNCAVKRNN